MFFADPGYACLTTVQRYQIAQKQRRFALWKNGVLNSCPERNVPIIFEGIQIADDFCVEGDPNINS